MAIFKGAGVAIVTPMYEDGKVNYDKLEELLEFQIANSTDAIIICGTTGESSTMTHGEHLKTIKFAIDKTNLPKGTQLTLVDAKDKRVYYYTTTGEEANNGNVLIALSSFVDSEGNPYQEPSISELIQAKASDQGGNKLFIKVGENGKPENAKDEDGRKYPEPTVRIKNETTGKYEYYRLAVSGETATHSITVNEAGLKGTGGVSDITENYYLVMFLRMLQTTF
mgnify:CR=1 FL=1